MCLVLVFDVVLLEVQFDCVVGYCVLVEQVVEFFGFFIVVDWDQQGEFFGDDYVVLDFCFGFEGYFVVIVVEVDY